MSKKRNKSSHKKSQKALDPIVVPSGNFDVVIVGGGASGLTCAISCAQAAKVPLRIAVLEAGKRVGASIMRSGNGRCNFSNAELEVSRYYHRAFVEHAFSALNHNPQIPSVLEWFEQLGLVWQEIPGTGGLLYPFSNKANSVLDVLKCALEEQKVELYTYSSVQFVNTVYNRVDSANLSYSYELPSPKGSVSSSLANEGNSSLQEKGFCVIGETRISSEEVVLFKICANQVVIASGGATSSSMLKDFNLSYVDPVALLGPLKATLATCNTSCTLSELDGIRMQVRLSVPARSFEEEGEVLFREYGISGIVVFNASRYVHQNDEVILDLAPSYSFENLKALFEQRRIALHNRETKYFLTGFVVDPLAQVLLQCAGLWEREHLTTQDVSALAKLCKAFPLIVHGIADERACQVKRGGIQLSEINPATMQAKANPDVFILGEALDVDGPCGGYNLHWAWTTGLLSGDAIALNYSQPE